MAGVMILQVGGIMHQLSALVVAKGQLQGTRGPFLSPFQLERPCSIMQEHCNNGSSESHLAVQLEARSGRLTLGLHQGLSELLALSLELLPCCFCF
jgi:hypothetical protein